MALVTRIVAATTFLLSYKSMLSSAWTLKDTYDANSWSSKMSFETGVYNNEFVHYLMHDEAISSGLIQNQNGKLYLGVDSTSTIDPNGSGRKALRIRSNNAYGVGTLVIGDFTHIPTNVCGVWPAFWMLGGANWPAGGEIDILESVNEKTQNQLTLHTNPGCKPGIGEGGETGRRTGPSDCGNNHGSTGCSVLNTRSEGWGDAFNAAGGGVVATSWTLSGIKIWQWTAAEVPSDIRSGAPDPESWGKPVANWGGGCDYATYFTNMQVIVNTAFCGNWAGDVWQSGSCASKAPDCRTYVASNPSVFANAYWLINSIQIFGQAPTRSETNGSAAVVNHPSTEHQPSTLARYR